MYRVTTLLFCAVFALLASDVRGQGLLVPEGSHDHWRLPRPIIHPVPERFSYKIKDLAIHSSIEDQVARTEVSQTFVNTSRIQGEVQFVFPLPYDGAIDRLTFMVDGREIEARLLPADEARQIYESYVRRYQDPALLEWMGRGMFRTSVFPLPPGAERTVSLRYTQLLKKDEKITDYIFPLSTAKYTAQPIEKLSFRIAINSSQKLKNIYSPNYDVTVDRSDDQHAVVSFQASGVVPGNDMRLLFDTQDQAIGASLLSYWPAADKDGYFVLLASPQFKAQADQPARKTVIFVVDKSGSMNGNKIEQAKGAAEFVLNNLNQGDLFNIVAYDAAVESFQPELQRVDDKSRSAARGFINGLFAGGSTNIDAALSTALTMIQDSSTPSYIVFLTDGLPTAGERNEARIVANAKQTNHYGARLISFGVGYDVNSRLLDRLTRANRGQSQYVRPDEDIEEHVSRLYQKISAPVLTDVQITYDFDGMEDPDHRPINRVYPAEALDIFAGQQLAVVGRYRNGGPATVTLRGKVGEEEKTFEYAVDFARQGDGEKYGFVEQLWAARRIGEIIDLLDLEGKNEELIKELVDLSTRHGILTPYTSFLADENAAPGQLANRRFSYDMAGKSAEDLQQYGGQYGFQQRDIKQQLKSAQSAAPGLRLGGGGAGGARTLGADAEEEKIVDIVRKLGRETLYRRGNLLIASNAADIDPDKDRDQITELVRFSDEYFKLVASNDEEENKLLANQMDDEELIVRLQGKVYRVK